VDIAPLIVVPTAFSPNQDGRNDLFGILKTRNIQEILEFSIYNRFGEKVFSTTDINQRWDGVFNGRNQPMANYVWVIKATSYDGLPISENGQFTLLR
jgi:gliding motility-associated-like protein